ncbi:MAG: RagB/SusD family nutrient uptake outer membrane protein [Fimbriimonadaceae bacterium]|nr:RagB/SusD family nutrient uptake outer membrane protein [Chitinophagales bacterium]
MSIGFNSCNIDELEDPNSPGLTAIEADATISELNNLVTGMEAGMRPFIEVHLDVCGIIGREYYRMTGADPRFTSDLLGKGETILDNNTFYSANSWGGRYAVVRNGWILRHAIDNTSADLTNEEKNGYRGFAKTIQAYQLLLNANLTYDCGVRLDVEDIDNPGPFTADYHASIEGIMAMLDDAKNDLDNSGDAFTFPLSGGFAGFDTPASFRTFNRALMARVLLYHEDYAGALAALSESFMDLGGALSTGTYNIFSNGAGDVLNPMFVPLNSSAGGNTRVVQDTVVADAEPGDLRLAKAPLRDEPAFADDLTSNYDLWVYQSSDAPICIIRNEELVLIYAEASMRTGATGDATTAINKIRTEAGGLAAYSGGTGDDDLLNEILDQRRYSLLAEGHRWVDMRRTGKLGELPTDRPGDDVYENLPRPYDEGEPCQ